MTLLARVILLVAGGVHLPAVLAGRMAAEAGWAFDRIVMAEAAGGLVGCVVSLVLLSLGRRRRPAGLRWFSRMVILFFAVVWLVLFSSELVGISAERLWAAARYGWAAAAACSLIVWAGAWIFRFGKAVS